MGNPTRKGDGSAQDPTNDAQLNKQNKCSTEAGQAFTEHKDSKKKEPQIDQNNKPNTEEKLGIPSRKFLEYPNNQKKEKKQKSSSRLVFDSFSFCSSPWGNIPTAY